MALGTYSACLGTWGLTVKDYNHAEVDGILGV